MPHQPRSARAAAAQQLRASHHGATALLSTVGARAREGRHKERRKRAANKILRGHGRGQPGRDYIEQLLDTGDVDSNADTISVSYLLKLLMIFFFQIDFRQAAYGFQNVFKKGHKTNKHVVLPIY